MKADQLRAAAFEQCELSAGAPVLAAVSGGPDSLCMLDSLARIGLPVIAAHFDHALRPDSADDALFVGRVAARMGIPFVTRREDAAAHARQERMTIEEAARDLRYRFLFDAAQSAGAQAVAVGHNADDQVETLLMHLLRGAGLHGMAGMSFRAILPSFHAQIPLVRPLLSFWREEILAYCDERGLEPRIDPTNEDTKYFRNRLRHELIPLLEQYNPRVREALWRTSRIAAAGVDVVEAATENAWRVVFLEMGEGAVALDAARLREQQPGLQRALLRRAAAAVQPALRDVDFAAIARAQQRLLSHGSGAVDLVDGISAFLEGDQLWIARSGALLPDTWPRMEAEHLLLAVPGSVVLAPGWRLTAAWEDVQETALSKEGFSLEAARKTAAASPWEACLHGDAISSPLLVRPPRPGDRFAPLGMDGHTMKLSDFWVNQKLPRRARAKFPLVLAGDEIAWVPGFRLAHPFRLREETRRAVLLRLIRET